MTYSIVARAKWRCGNQEAGFWVAVMLANNRRYGEARDALAPLVAQEPGWAAVLRELPGVGLLDMPAEDIERLLLPDTASS